VTFVLKTSKKRLTLWAGGSGLVILLSVLAVQVSRVGWPWGRGGENKQSERIAALERANESQESQLRLIKVEWESVLDKVNSVMGRLNARIRKFEATSGAESHEEEQPQAPASPHAIGSHTTLSAMRGRKRGVLPG